MHPGVRRVSLTERFRYGRAQPGVRGVSLSERMADRGATVLNTAPRSGASEDVASRIVNELGIANKVFWAAKLNAAQGRGGTADPAAARAQVERSFAMIKKPKIDCIQVRNLVDVRDSCRS